MSSALLLAIFAKHSVAFLANSIILITKSCALSKSSNNFCCCFIFSLLLLRFCLIGELFAVASALVAVGIFRNLPRFGAGALVVATEFGTGTLRNFPRLGGFVLVLVLTDGGVGVLMAVSSSDCEIAICVPHHPCAALLSARRVHSVMRSYETN